MSRILIEYNPKLSDKICRIIRNEVTASMVSNDEMSCQYDISMVKKCLDDVFEQGLEDVDIEESLELIDTLIKEGVHYIEF